MKPIVITAVIALTPLLCACDEGRIYDDATTIAKEGLVAKATLDVSGWDEWPEGYSVALAAFREGDDYAIISKPVGFSTGGEASVMLTGIPADVSSIEFCAIDKLRRRVATFTSTTDLTPRDTIRLAASDIDVSPAQVIQDDIFNTTCVNCHGASNFAAAGLHLTHPRSFGELVGVESTVEPSHLRVKAADSENSLLWQILSSDESTGWHYDHSAEVTSSERLDLLKAWIENGAKY